MNTGGSWKPHPIVICRARGQEIPDEDIPATAAQILCLE